MSKSILDCFSISRKEVSLKPQVAMATGCAKRAIIFGATGQDGSYLAEQLLEKGYEVVGVARRRSNGGFPTLKDAVRNRAFRLVGGDVTDAASVCSLIGEYEPDEVYNLAAQSHVGTSFGQPRATMDSTAIGCLNILEAIRRYPNVRFYQASSSEMFGACVDQDGMQRETTPMLPCSPYGVAKLSCHHLVRVYREAYGLFACSGILFNHESERRGDLFVTRKITKYVGRLHHWLRRDAGMDMPLLNLGNLNAIRDWGYAPEFTEAMWMMLQQDYPDDYVIATGVSHSVYDFLVSAFGAIGLDESEVRLYVKIQDELVRPCEVDRLCGDSTKAREALGWSPQVYMNELASIMVKNDVEKAKEEAGEWSPQNSQTGLER